MQIKLSTSFPQDPIIRQTPGRSGNWKEAHFSINDGIKECDYWAVIDGLLQPEKTHCSSGRTVFVTFEPPGLKVYRRGFLKQFDLIITCHTDFKHPNVRHTYQGLNWHAGIIRSKTGQHSNKTGRFEAALDYDAFSQMPIPEKPRLLSVVCSNRTFLKGHRLRLAFVEELKKAFGDSVDVFGHGIRPVEDKIEAIAPYRYHVVLENSVQRDYWTEKLADTFLGFAHPFYSGCPNIDNYFSPKSLTKIDITKPADAIATIQSAIAGDVYNRDLESRLIARRQVLDDYNTFEIIRRACATLPPVEPRTVSLIRNESFERWNPKRIAAGLHFRFKRLIGAKTMML